MKLESPILCLVEKGPPPVARCVSLAGSPRAQELRHLFARAHVFPARLGPGQRAALVGVSNTVAVLQGYNLTR